MISSNLLQFLFELLFQFFIINVILGIYILLKSYFNYKFLVQTLLKHLIIFFYYKRDFGDLYIIENDFNFLQA